MKYTVEFSRPATREFRKLPLQIQHRLELRIEKLSREPRPRDSKKMAGSQDRYRVREGDFRIIYEVQDRILLIIVVRVGHRRDVYRKM